ncbi:MAG: hypothetical protein NC417_08680 [Candidatus Gastranaerophilales bacterium]|nr:hypothetical protein [Candidatus Gastranaerophilales bacterium]
MTVRGVGSMMEALMSDGDIRFQAVYLGYKDEREYFTKQDNDEMDRLKLWDLKEDVGYFDESDLEIAKLITNRSEE